MYVDTHSHIFDSAFDDDRREAIDRAISLGVTRIILPAIDSSTHSRMIDTALQYPSATFATIGLHPTSVNENPDFAAEIAEIERLLKNPPVKFYAIGEIGLDLYWSRDFLAQQVSALKIQLEIALRHDLPVILHVRDAWDEIFPILEAYKGLRGIFHSFSGGIDQYLRAMAAGDFMIGIGGVATYKKSDLPTVIAEIPLSKIVLETDSPYLPPVPHRGHRNESSYIPIIAAKVAEIKGITIGEVEQTTTKNAERVFFSR